MAPPFLRRGMASSAEEIDLDASLDDWSDSGESVGEAEPEREAAGPPDGEKVSGATRCGTQRCQPRAQLTAMDGLVRCRRDGR